MKLVGVSIFSHRHYGPLQWFSSS